MSSVQLVWFDQHCKDDHIITAAPVHQGNTGQMTMVFKTMILRGTTGAIT
jgi:hypothetical protein